MNKMKKAPQTEHKLWDVVRVTKGFFEGLEGFLVNIDYEGGSFEIRPDVEITNGSNTAYYVYVDEIELIERGTLAPDEDYYGDDDDDDSFYDGEEEE